MKNVAIVFELNQNWIGGSYYIRNLIVALGTLPEKEQPEVFLLSERQESVEFILEANYRKLNWIKLSEFEKNPDRYPFDVIFPHPVADQDNRTISWIPDFQELHLPYYFTEREVAERRHHHIKRFKTSGLIVSSDDVKSDVERFYPDECPNIQVVHFATFDKFDENAIHQIKEKYKLPERYVMCPNQLWVHKNHIVVLKALSILKSRDIDVKVCFTGNESDYRLLGYANNLKALTTEWNLDDRVRFLGFIPRSDQLTLMSGADYIVQPSLFEGWSTVIEDAKAMNQFVVASDLSVHHEQLDGNCRHFPRHNPHALAEIMEEFSKHPPKNDKSLDYNQARKTFGKDFMVACERFGLTKRAKNTLKLIELKTISKQNLQPIHELQMAKTNNKAIGSNFDKEQKKATTERDEVFASINARIESLSKSKPRRNVRGFEFIGPEIWLSTKEDEKAHFTFDPLPIGFRLQLDDGDKTPWASLSFSIPKEEANMVDKIELSLSLTSGGDCVYRPCLRYLYGQEPFVDVFAENTESVGRGVFTNKSILSVDKQRLSNTSGIEVHLFFQGSEMKAAISSLVLSPLRIEGSG